MICTTYYIETDALDQRCLLKAVLGCTFTSLTEYSFQQFTARRAPEFQPAAL